MEELNDASSHRSLFIDNEHYNNILREVTEAQKLRKDNQPLTSKHYRRLKKIGCHEDRRYAENY